MDAQVSQNCAMLKVTFRSGGAGEAPAPGDDATNHDQRTVEPAAAPAIPGGLKRSRNVGAELLLSAGIPWRHQNPLFVAAAALRHFSPDVQALMPQAVQNPGRVSGRQTTDLVWHVFTKPVEAARYGEPARRPGSAWP